MLDKNIEIKETENEPSHMIKGRVAEIYYEGNSIGFMGEVHPKILKNWRIKMPVTILEINLEKIFN